MYGDVAVIGSVDFDGMRVFDAIDRQGIKYYQAWIQHSSRLFTMLTTTVHADFANRELRNNFRTRFQIDCVCFAPDEQCENYSSRSDIWLGLSHWSSAFEIGFGPSSVVKNLQWCAVSTEAFERENLGFKGLLHPNQTTGKDFVFRKRGRLAAALRSAYARHNRVVVIGF